MTRQPLTRTLTGAQYITESVLRALEYLTTSSEERPLRTNVAAPRQVESGEAPLPPDFNQAVRAAHRTDNISGPDVNGIAAPPSLNASVLNFMKRIVR